MKTVSTDYMSLMWRVCDGFVIVETSEYKVSGFDFFIDFMAPDDEWAVTWLGCRVRQPFGRTRDVNN
ncbi:hypothetical protein KDX38_24980 [Pseudomonas sp. CDFA 602]|uniref:hypothetical protein n=1 Tax=Pseudomonas californiensis TaxID=2829823 RepID=UPI001E41314E|nr:hypothetical protein [Pseudomonas californiensis]MCD5992963.1 hypothetical protein [Pseudomonas californiensis]MCD6002438.1 hypothetical protein [Pseudomonas californiensis]